MAVEIRELIVRVTVETDKSKSRDRLDQRDRKSLVEECVREVMKRFKQKQLR